MTSCRVIKFLRRFLMIQWDVTRLSNILFMINKIQNVYDLITNGETAYTKPIDIEDGWKWSMKDHLRRSYLYLNSQFEENNENRKLRPNRNIILPILNVQYRTEDFDVKDIEIYVDNPDEYYKSFLIKKYHEKWALENGIDTFIDEMVVSYCTYGGVLVRKTDHAKPDVIDLRNIAFCNQTDILNYPFAIRHKFSASQLRTENKKWGKTDNGATASVEELITLSKKEDDEEIEVFEVHGLMPTEWLEDNNPDNIDEDEKDVPQIQIVSFYKDDNDRKTGVTLFKHKEPVLPFNFLARDNVDGRALGRGGVEELFESQIWTNWDEIKTTEMLNSASKTLHFSDDPTFKSRNNLDDAENGEVFNLQDGKKIQQIDTFPRNLQLFNDSIQRWQQHAQIVGSASDPLLGESPSAGTPFKLYEAQQMESKGMHKYRQGKLAVFMDEIYRDWILPYLGLEIVKEQVFMQELSFEEMQMVSEKVMTIKTNEFKKQMILSMQEVSEELVDLYRQQVEKDFAKEGNKRFFKILKDEMKDTKLSVMTNIAGKQKNLALLTDKLVNVLRQYISTPQIRQDPEMTKILNTILESSGLSPIKFSPAPQEAQMQPQMAQQAQGGQGGQAGQEQGIQLTQ